MDTTNRKPSHTARLTTGLVTFLIAWLLLIPSATAQLDALIADRAAEIEDKVIAWRRDIHQHPELSNREFRTADLVAEHLRALGMEVETEVAYTGVVGTLVGGQPGPVVALRADMDALPVVEQSDYSFRSTVRTTYNGLDVGVMHACGHDTHVAILMGAAEILASMREEIPGTIKFIFQPAEEGGHGAREMIHDGALDGIDTIYGWHNWPAIPFGKLVCPDDIVMSGNGTFELIVNGKE